MLIALAGLPATGKSAICRELAPLLSAVALDKDQVRAALFPPPEIDYSDEQKDLCMRVIFQVAGYILQCDPRKHVIIDGRTFSRHAQIETLKQAAAEMPARLCIIECVCSEATALARLKAVDAAAPHVAADRDERLYARLKENWEPIEEPHLVLDTDCRSLQECAYLARDYVLDQSSATRR
jgi:predicted kinase